MAEGGAAQTGEIDELIALAQRVCGDRGDIGAA
jgi:hypothetical protein